MDELAAIQGRDIADVLDTTVAIAAPLLTKNKAFIQEIPFKTFQFGPTERHQLDVYYPLNPHKSGKTPVLFFVYGGGFITGARNLSAKFDLVYANVGAFFARQGILTVIADYRLVPQAKYPQPVEDVRDAIAWVIQNPDLLKSDGSPSPDLQNITVMGHSAGAAHSATLLFNIDVLPLDSDIRSRIARLALFAGPYHLADLVSGTPRAEVYEQYFGSVEEAQKNDPYSLFLRFPDGALGRLPKIVLLKATEEPGFLDKSSEELKAAMTERFKRDQKMIVAKGHNHISVNWVLGIGEGEEWAYEVAEWISTEASA